MISVNEYLITEVLNEAKETLSQASQMLELDKAQSKAAAKAAKKARQQAHKAARLFDAAVLRRIGRSALVGAEEFDVDGLIALAGKDAAVAALEPLKPAHMPSLFPEVFARDNPGFDVLVGNPPWEKLHVKEDAWWTKHRPGLLGLKKKARDTEIKRLRRDRPDLVEMLEREVAAKDSVKVAVGSGQFPGIGEAHIDLYSAFAWRNLQVIRDEGMTGLVLPKSAWSGASLAEWRRKLLERYSIHSLVYLVNEKKWVFPEVDGRYSFSLCVLKRSTAEAALFSGPYYSLTELVNCKNDVVAVSPTELLGWSENASFPSLPTTRSLSVFRKFQGHKSLVDSGSLNIVRLNQGDFNITTNRGLYDLGAPTRATEMPVLGGGSISLWNCDHNDAYGHADRRTLMGWLRTRHKTQHADSDYLPCEVARIAIRQISRSTDTRTILSCLVPPESALASGAHYVSFTRSDPAKEAFLLGVLGSQIFDWYARRWIELNVTFELLGPMPIPSDEPTSKTFRRVVELAGGLAAVDSRFADWAAVVGVKVGELKSLEEREEALAEIDASVAAAYGLSQSDVKHIFDTFHRGGDYRDHCAAVLSHLKAMGIS
jgi:hypothetical protein